MSERTEQARLLGMSAEREIALRARSERDQLRDLLRRAEEALIDADESVGDFVVKGELRWPTSIGPVLRDIRSALEGK